MSEVPLYRGTSLISRMARVSEDLPVDDRV